MNNNTNNNNKIKLAGTMYPYSTIDFQSFNISEENYVKKMKFLIESGCEMIRFNRAHNKTETSGCVSALKLIRKIAEETNKVCLVEWAIANQNSKRRVYNAEGRYKAAETMTIFKNNIENQIYTDLGSKKIEVGTYCSIGDSRNQMTVISGDNEKVVVRWNVDYKITGNPGIYFFDSLPESSGLDEYDYFNIKEALNNGVDILSCSFVNNPTLAKEYYAAIHNYLKPGQKVPLLVFKLETSEPFDHLKEMMQYCDAFELSRGDLIQNTGLKSVIYQDQALSFCKENSFPIRVYTDIGGHLEDNKLLNRNCMFAIHSYIKNGGTVLGFSLETIFGEEEYMTNMFQEVKELVNISVGNSSSTIVEDTITKEEFLKNYKNNITMRFKKESEYRKYFFYRGVELII